MPWTDADERTFAVMLFAMGELYETPVSTARVELFCRAVEDLPFAEVQRAAQGYVRSGKFFPRPADLRELVEGNVEDQAEAAWAHIHREVRRVGWMGTPSWPDEATRRAALELFGSWRALCENLPAAGPEYLGFAKRFKSSFIAFAHLAPLPALPSRSDDAQLLADRIAAIREHERAGDIGKRTAALAVATAEFLHDDGGEK